MSGDRRNDAQRPTAGGYPIGQCKHGTFGLCAVCVQEGDYVYEPAQRRPDASREDAPCPWNSVSGLPCILRADHDGKHSHEMGFDQETSESRVMTGSANRDNAVNLGAPSRPAEAPQEPDIFLSQATEFLVDLQRRGRSVNASDIGPLASMLKRAHDDGARGRSEAPRAPTAEEDREWLLDEIEGARDVLDGIRKASSGPERLHGASVNRVRETAAARAMSLESVLRVAGRWDENGPKALRSAAAQRQAIDVICPYCKAGPGAVCRDANTGELTAHESREEEAEIQNRRGR